jgi:hypothetical protein
MAMPNPSQPKLPDYYDVLGLDINATADEVSKAFRQKARGMHPDKQADANVNDWHELHKAYTTLSDKIKRQVYNEKLVYEDTEGEPDHTQLSLPNGFKMSEMFKLRFSGWMNVKLQDTLGSFCTQFHLGLKDMLDGCCQKDKLVQLNKTKDFNFEDMMTSIAAAVKVNASSPAIKQVTKHLVHILRAAQTSKQCSKVSSGRVPILDISGCHDSDLLFLLNLFTSVDAHPEKREDVEKRLMVFVPVIDVHEGMFKAKPSRKCIDCTESLDIIVCCASCYHKSVSSLKEEPKCPNCQALLPRVLNECYSCKNFSCIKCPTHSIRAPRIGVNYPRPICQECTTKLALKDAEDWTAQALCLMQSQVESSLKAAMTCVVIAIHTAKDLPLPQLRAVAKELLKQSYHEQALLILSVIKEVSNAKHDVKLYLLVAKTFHEISGKPGKPRRERCLLLQSARQAIQLAEESVSQHFTIDVPHLSRIHDEILKSVTEIEQEKECRYNALVDSFVCELERAWESYNLTKMQEIAKSTEVMNKDALIPKNGIEPGVRALEIFLNKKRELIPSMVPSDRCAIHFFQGYVFIGSDQFQNGLDLIQKAIWSGYHYNWLAEAATSIVASHIVEHPSLRNDMVKVGEEILKIAPSQQIGFASLLNVLEITRKDLNPSIKSCWSGLNVQGINKAGTRRCENTVSQQVIEGKLTYFEAGCALIDLTLSASHASETVVCLLNASLWFLEDLRSKQDEDLNQMHALKMMTLSCVDLAYYFADLALHPGMQLYTSRFGLAITAEAITVAGKCATAEDSKLLLKLYRSVVQKGRFSPFWKMPIVPVCEALRLNILTGRLHAEFMLHLQRDQSNPLLKTEEIKYQLYENDLRWFCPVEDKDATRERAMEALLQAKGLSWSDISDSMCSVLSPRTPDGWLLQQKHLGGNLPFATLTGFELNTDFNNPFIKLNAIPAGHTNNGLFSANDVKNIFQIPKKDLFPIFFSLDSPSGSQHFHPFQQLRFEPSSLQSTDILHTLLQTDYLMKCFSIGSDVSSKPPFKQRDCSEGLTAKLPPHLQKVLTPIAERGSCRNRTSRLWIQADEVEFKVKENGSQVHYQFGAVKMVVRTSPQFPGPDGKLHDIDDEDPDSPESRFAKDLTENYTI